MRDRFQGPYDAVLHLLDRQVLDRDGLMVCKVDDIELERRADGIYALGLLAGPVALLPRFGRTWGRRVLRFWERLSPEQQDRDLPYRIGLDAVAEVTSAVRLRVPRDGALERGRPAMTLQDLLRLPVRDAAGRPMGRVIDVRFGRFGEGHRVVGLLVGPGRPGSMLGYDRDGERGPVLVRAVVRWLHRHARYVAWSELGVDWASATVTVTGRSEPPGPTREQT